MRPYSITFQPETCAYARAEGVDSSYKDLSEICGRIKGKNIERAFTFLEKVTAMEIPVLYSRHNKKLGHRKELSGRKGRYPQKAAKIVLKTLKSAVANGKVKGLGNDYIVLHISANKKAVYPRLAAKGRRNRQYYETATVEIVLKSTGIAPKGVEVKAPEKTDKPTVGEMVIVPEHTKKVVEKQQKKEDIALHGTEPHDLANESAPQTKQEQKLTKDMLQATSHSAIHEHKHSQEKSEHHDHKKLAIEHSKGKKTEVKK
jgi:large subunit ribosomal protein L22